MGAGAVLGMLPHAQAQREASDVGGDFHELY
jgi:hypothetical protein